MASTTFVDYQTVISASWLNDVNAATYNAGVPVTAAGVQGQIAAIAAAVAQLAGKNVIVNGDCSVAQVNGATLITPLTLTYPADMCLFGATQASKIQFQQVANKLNSLGATAANNWSVLASYAPIATDYFECLYSIEGYNFARFQWGTANAKPASLQFKVNASVAGTYSGAITNYASTRAYPFSFTVAAGVDTLITIPNIPGDTGGTWVGATNAGAALVKFDLGAGSNYKGTANAWASANLCGVTGSLPFVSQANGSTLSITDVQLEQSTYCTQFERKLYAQVLWESQRYLRPLVTSSCPGQAISTTVSWNFSNGPPMRALPSYTTTVPLQATGTGGVGIPITILTVSTQSPDGTIAFFNTVASGLVAGSSTFIVAGNGYFGSQI